MPASHHDVTAVDAPVQRPLSRRQKWDLGLLFLAGLISTALFSAPLLLPAPAPPQSASVLSDPIAAGGAVQIMTELEDAVVTWPEMAEASSERRFAAPRRVSRGLKDRSGLEEPGIVAARVNTPLVRKLGRLVAGDGRYIVRPFPTIEPEQR